MLYAACRQHDSVYAWDTRNPSAPYATYERKSTTNQKLWIDVDAAGAWLVSGDTVHSSFYRAARVLSAAQDGNVSFFNLSSETESTCPEHTFHAHDGTTGPCSGMLMY